MKYIVRRTAKFKKDYKRMIRRGYDISKLNTVIELLAENGNLPEKYLDHALKGEWLGFRECHVEPDWLLVYKIENDVLVLTLTNTGTHADIFG